MQRLLLSLLLPTIVYAAVQCYVGQKLFSYESNNAICARFIPYHCATSCEWKSNCSSHSSYSTFRGRRTFVSGLLMNTKSMMVLCCTSLSTRIEVDSAGREKCVWRDTESIAVLGPSIRTNPVLAPNHYIRDVKLERDGAARVDVALEVCQYQTEREHCNVEKMDDNEKRRFNLIQLKLQRGDVKTSTLQKTQDGDKQSDEKTICQLSQTTCGRTFSAQIQNCCKDRSICDRDCLKGIENTITTSQSGCSSEDIRQASDCIGRQVNNLS